MSHSRIFEIDDLILLNFYCGELPADPSIAAAGHEPNGYFWEGVTELVAPEIMGRVELDSEAGMFSASGSAADLEKLQAVLEPIISSPDMVAEVIVRAHTEGFEFDD